MLMTFAIAAWATIVLGIRDVNVLLVITFSWTATAALRLAAIPPSSEDDQSLWGADFGIRAAAGVVVWLGLPALRLSHPDLWIWQPLVMPEQLSATGATLALCWPLWPFWVDLPDHARRDLPGSDVETLLLTCSLFLVSGSPILALFSMACLFSWCSKVAVPSPALVPSRFGSSSI